MLEPTGHRERMHDLSTVPLRADVPTEKERFDYVIVGAGSAGCVLAARLSEDPEVSVLLLEAGPPDHHWKIHVPAGFPELFKGHLDWAFETEPEPGAAGRRLFWPRGRVLGGSSSINAMLYIRGHRNDYDRWRDLGNPGWGFEDVLPYFLRAEDQGRGASELHGVGGPLPVRDPIAPNVLSKVFVEAGLELGWPRNDDFNGPRQEGVGLYQVNQRKGRRASAAVAYLGPVKRRGNLAIRTGAQVLRVVFEGERAVGVDIARRHGGLRRVRAEREVILASGAVGSPHLLMLSGVGPAAQLEAHGVPVVADLPGVGGHLQDHPVVSVICRSKESVTLDSAETLGNFLRYLFFRKGPFTSSLCEGGAFVHSGVSPADDEPDIQFHFLPVALKEHGFEDATDQGVNFGVTLLRPRSLGAVRLASADARRPPHIEPGYLGAERDVAALVAGVRMARDLTRTRAFAPHLDYEVAPGDAVESDEDLAHFVRSTMETLYHPVGTCRMGPAEALGGEHPPVVDPECRVHGLRGLRVVDASVMPEIIGGNTHAPTVMIAEKASDLILRSRGV
jgi:choline dehydrogenase